MPKWLHEELRKQAEKKKLKGKRKKRYIYGGLVNWTKQREK